MKKNKNLCYSVVIMSITIITFFLNSCSTELSENVVQEEKGIIIRKVSLKSLSQSENIELFKSVSKIRENNRNMEAKIVYDSINKFYFDDENGKEIIAPNGKKSYTFSIYADEESADEKKVENILFAENDQNKYDAYRIKYNFTEEQLKTLPREELQELSATYNNLASKMAEPMCAYIMTWQPFPNDHGELTGNFANLGNWVINYMVCDNTPPSSGTSGGGIESSGNNTNTPTPSSGNSGYTTPVVLEDDEKAWAEYYKFTNGLSDDLENWLKLPVNSPINVEVFNYLTLNGYSGRNISSMKNYIRICIALEDNPNLLLDIPCAQLQYWLTLAQYDLPISTINKVSNLQDINSETVPNWDIQFLGGAQGALVNMDFFPVTISQFPNNPATSQPYTPQQFYNFFRLHINQFVEGTGVSFVPSTISGVNESTLWNSGNPINSIISINIPADSGSVICSNYTTSHWYFTTLTTPWAFSWAEDDYDGYHPVSGNREFGYYPDVNGNYVFYVRGVDRIHRKNVQRIARNLPGANSEFDDADALWNTMKQNLKNFVNNNGGTAIGNQNIIYRPNWSTVKDVLTGTRPLSDLGCD